MKKLLFKNSFYSALFVLFHLLFNSMAAAKSCQDFFRPDLILSISNERELLSGIRGRRFSSRINPSLEQSLLLMKANLIKDYNQSVTEKITTKIEVQIFKTQVLLEMIGLNRSLTRSDLLKIQTELNLSLSAKNQIRRSQWINFFLYQTKNLSLSLVLVWMIDELIDYIGPDNQTHRWVPLRDILSD